jgi:hypothetical protein
VGSQQCVGLKGGGDVHEFAVTTNPTEASRAFQTLSDETVLDKSYFMKDDFFAKRTIVTGHVNETSFDEWKWFVV